MRNLVRARAAWGDATVTEDELRNARDSIDGMEQDAARGTYFEIPPEDARILAAYIRELEQRVVPR